MLLVSRQRLILVALTLLLVGGTVSQLDAQVLKGQILGTITDPSAAVIPGASVTLTETNTNVAREGETNESGLYVFPNLDPGMYQVEASSTGFSTVVRGEIDLQPNSTVRVNLELTPGAVTETVTVTGAPPVLQTDRADTSVKIESQQLKDLPLLFNRNYQGLMATVPGVGRLTRPHSQFYNSQDSLAVRVNGQGRQYNNFQIEGIENKIDNGNLTALVPPAEAIQTVDISTSNFDPEFGNAGGSVVNVTLRSGTNDFHGSVFAFHRNENAQARQVFATNKAHTVYNQFGFTAGGPIVKNKMFIFGDYQGSRDHLGEVELDRIPTSPFRIGDFSGESATIYDAATGDARGRGRTAFTNNIIPLDRISPISNAMVGFIPQPNRPGPIGSRNQEIPIVRIKNINAFDVKYDYVVSDAGRLTVRYSLQKATVTDCGLYGPNCGIYGGPRNNGFSGSGPARTQSPMISYSHVFSPTLVWEGRFGIVRNRNDAINADSGLRTAEEIGIPGVNVNEWTSGLSEVRIDGLDRPLVGFSPSLPWARSVTFFGITNNFTKTHGNHITRFGFEVRRERNDLLQTQTFNPRGRFTFSRGQTACAGDCTGPNQSLGIANAFAAFLLDRPGGHGRDLDVQFPTRRELILAGYIQDKWQLSSKLTIDFGLRVERENPSRPRFAGSYSNYNPLTNALELNGIGGRPNDNGVRSDLGWGPRIGISYRLNEKTVVRTGYGISFINRIMGQQNFPVKQNNAFVEPNDFTASGSMAEGFPAFQEFAVPDSGIIDLNLPGNSLISRQSFGWVNPDMRRPYVQSWNFAIQRSLPAEFTLDLAYVGNHGVNNQSRWEYNGAMLPGTGNSSRPLNILFGRTQNTGTRIGTHTYYNALQMKLNRRFSNGFTMTNAYTWSKGLNFSDDTGGLQVDRIQGAFLTNKGRTNQDRRHTWVSSYTYELPFGKNKRFLQSGAGRWVLGDWQIQGLLSMMTGEPFTVTAPGSTLNAGGNSQRADVVGTPKRIGDIAGPNGDGLWFTTNAFARPQQGTLGNAGREILDGPGLFNWNFSVFRNFPIPQLGESAQLTFRLESFNFTNTPHFNNPNGDVSNRNFGKVQSASNEQRLFQFGMTLRF